MKNPIRIRTNSIERTNYDVYRYEDKIIFENDDDELRHQDDVKILYSGLSSQLDNLKGQITKETHVSFFDENSRQTKVGRVLSTLTTPYYEIEEDITRFRYHVHTKYIKSTSLTFKDLSNLYIQKIANNKYRKYDIGVVKIQARTFLTPEESLKDLTSKGIYVIMISSEK
jgi:hypothetical protein